MSDPVPSVFDRLKSRKLIQWTLGYVAAIWVVAQVLDVAADPWGLSLGFVRTVQMALVLLVPVVLVLAWFHGEQGHQRITKVEVLLLAVLLVGGGAALVVLDPMAEGPVEVVAEPLVDEAAPLNPNSIVVLPFRDLSVGEDQEYMGYGVAGEVLSLLTEIPAIRAISQTTAFAIAESGSTSPEIAQRLNVAHVLEGSVAAVGEAIRITATLVDPWADSLLFSQRFEGSLDDIWALQDSIAAQVVSALEISLLGPLPTLEKTDPEAYRTFLQARYIADRSSDNYDVALPMFEEVLAVDPDHSPTLLEVAVIYLDWSWEGVVPFEEGSQRVQQAIERVLEKDPENVYALVLQSAWVTQSMEFEAAAELIDRAYALGPSHPEVLMGVGLLLQTIGRPTEAIPFLEAVRDIDPLYPINLSNLAEANFAAGRLEETAALYRELLAMSPGHAGAHTMLSVTLTELGDPESALVEAALEDRPVWRIPAELVALHGLGRTNEFESNIEQFQDAVGEGFPAILGFIYALVGENDLAFEWFERTPPAMTLVPAVVPWLSGRDIADDPRWEAFRERVGQSRERLDAIQLDARLPSGN